MLEILKNKENLTTNQEITSFWDQFGLLKHLNKGLRLHMAILFEKTANFLFQEENLKYACYDTIVFPIFFRVIRELDKNNNLSHLLLLEKYSEDILTPKFILTKIDELNPIAVKTFQMREDKTIDMEAAVCGFIANEIYETIISKTKEGLI